MGRAWEGWGVPLTVGSLGGRRGLGKQEYKKGHKFKGQENRTERKRTDKNTRKISLIQDKTLGKEDRAPERRYPSRLRGGGDLLLLLLLPLLLLRGSEGGLGAHGHCAVQRLSLVQGGAGEEVKVEEVEEE